jgi:hypothetical protein
MWCPREGCAYAAKGLENEQLVERVDQPRQIVSKRRKRFAERGMAGL